MGSCTQEAALWILSIVPQVMRTVAAELRHSDRSILPGHYHVLIMLDGQSFSLSQIAERQHVSLPTMSRSISTLVERGWVERIPDDSDGRITRLRLTAEGEAVSAEFHRVAAETVTRQLAGLTAQECRQLVSGLRVLHQAFEHPGPGMRESSRAGARQPRSVSV
jgi:DNA-binding MarR family transcriptional regulator